MMGGSNQSSMIELLVFSLINTIFCTTEARKIDMTLLPNMFDFFALVLTPSLHEELDDDVNTFEVSPTSVTASPNLRNFENPPLLPELTTNASTVSCSYLKRRPSKPNGEICSYCNRFQVKLNDTIHGTNFRKASERGKRDIVQKIVQEWCQRRRRLRRQLRRRLRLRRCFGMTTDAGSWQVLGEIADVNAVSAIFSCRLYPPPLQS
jgi:hypothetical protein